MSDFLKDFIASCSTSEGGHLFRPSIPRFSKEEIEEIRLKFQEFSDQDLENEAVRVEGLYNRAMKWGARQFFPSNTIPQIFQETSPPRDVAAETELMMFKQYLDDLDLRFAEVKICLQNRRIAKRRIIFDECTEFDDGQV